MVLYALNEGTRVDVCHLTNRSGAWQSTVLYSGEYAADSTIALDSVGLPHVVVASRWPGGIEYYTFDGTGWSNETVLTPEDTAESQSNDLSLVLDQQDLPHFLFTRYHFAGQYQSCGYAFNNGLGWSSMVVDRKDAGEALSAVMTANGTLYGAYLAGKEGKRTVTCLRATLPELAGVWKDAGLTGTATGTAFSGSMTVANNGAAKSTATFASLYLSDDSDLDANDTLLRASIRIRAMKPGAAASIKTRFRHAGSLSGKYLIALIDPKRATADRNRLNNTASVLLGL